jgi:hypothetical protein
MDLFWRATAHAGGGVASRRSGSHHRPPIANGLTGVAFTVVPMAATQSRAPHRVRLWVGERIGYLQANDLGYRSQLEL